MGEGCLDPAEVEAGSPGRVEGCPAGEEAVVECPWAEVMECPGRPGVGDTVEECPGPAGAVEGSPGAGGSEWAEDCCRPPARLHGYKREGCSVLSPSLPSESHESITTDDVSVKRINIMG